MLKLLAMKLLCILCLFSIFSLFIIKSLFFSNDCSVESETNIETGFRDLIIIHYQQQCNEAGLRHEGFISISNKNGSQKLKIYNAFMPINLISHYVSEGSLHINIGTRSKFHKKYNIDDVEITVSQ